LELERAVRPVLVVMLDVDAKDLFELATVEDQQPVETLSPGAAHPALDVRVCVRRPQRGPDDSHPAAVEDGVEKLRVPVVEQEPRPLAAVVEIHQQVPRLLHHPRTVRLRIRRIRVAGLLVVIAAIAALGYQLLRVLVLDGLITLRRPSQ
jgi:hypothetical protein